MVPAAYVRLEQLPLTPNGKLDRKALPAPEGEAFAQKRYESPVGEVEVVLSQIWSELLGVDRVGRHDSFFELGGHSLLAVQLVERLRRREWFIDIRTLFAQPRLWELAEAVRTARLQGVREVTLLGQNVNAYAGAMEDGTLADLATLIHFVAAIDGVERIRFTTSHPLDFNDSLIEAYANVAKLNNFLHLPVQSGSDRILAAMKRGHTVLEYKQKLRKLRAVRPDICISTDIIVGFPGETDQDFMATMNLIADVGFDQSFSFLYSRRPGTPAAALPDEVPHDVKQRRLELLQQRLNGQARAISERMVGSRQRVLVERPAKRNPQQLAGRTDNNRWVNFDGPAVDPLGLINHFADVEITEAMPNSLRGRLVEVASS